MRNAGGRDGPRRVLIESLGVYLPERRVSTADVMAGCAVQHQIPLEQATGIRSRRVAAAGEFAIDLAHAAIEDCLARSRYRAGEIDLLISASLSHYDAPGRYHAYEPSTALALKARFGFERAVAFDVANGCAGLWTAWLIAEALLATGSARCALLVSGEFITDLTRTAQREIASYLDPQIASLTVGDAGVALTLEAADVGNHGLEALDLYTVARYAPYCVTRPTSEAHGGGVMVTDSLRLGARSIDHVVTHLTETLRSAGWQPQTVAHLIPHQTSAATLVSGLKRINERLKPDAIPLDRYRINLAERGNTATTTQFLAIHDAMAAGEIRNGDRAAFCITGSGLVVGTALYTFDDLPDRVRQRGAPALRGSAPAPIPPELPVTGIAGVGLVRGVEAAPLDTTELCRRAGMESLTSAGCTPGDVDLVIHAGVYRSHFLVEPALAALAAGALDTNADAPPGAMRRTFAFDLLSGALGALKACWAADRLIRSGRYERALVLATDVENNGANSRHPQHGLETAGSALLLQRGGGRARFEHFHFRDFPEHRTLFESWAANPDGRPYLVVHRDPTFHDVAARCLEMTLRHLLQSCGLAIQAVDGILLAGGQPEWHTRLAGDPAIAERLIQVPGERDLMGSGFAAGLDALQGDGRAKPGARILVLAVGAGIQIGGALMTLE